MLLDCAVCKAKVDAVFEGDYDLERNDERPDTSFQLLRCPPCDCPFLVILETFYRGDAPAVELLYPQPYKPVSPSLPDNIRNVFDEAVRCHRSGTYTASVIMCRKTLEATCRHHKPTSRGLASALRIMRDEDVIDRQLFEWAEVLRFAGNAAVHDVDEAVSRQDAEDVMEFTHAILEYTYTYREKFKAFMARKKGENAQGGTN